MGSLHFVINDAVCKFEVNGTNTEESNNSLAYKQIEIKTCIRETSFLLF